MSGDSNSPWIKHTMPRHAITTTLCGAALSAIPVGAVQAESLKFDSILIQCLLVGLIQELNFDFGDALETPGNWYPIVTNGNLAGDVMGLGYMIALEEPAQVDGFADNPQWFADALGVIDDAENALLCYSERVCEFPPSTFTWGYWSQCSPPLGAATIQLFVHENVQITTIGNGFRLEADLFVSEEFGAEMLAAGWTLTNIGGSLAGTYRLDITTVPAPGAVAILGLAGLAGSRRRRD
ncbi:MAG: hypothetical protein ACO3EP_02305 [Phycisphaerales bacterium]